MSSKGIYTALSGAIAQNRKLETISNNIANVNTTGFKANKQVFNEYLTDMEKNPRNMRFHKFPATVESFEDLRAYDRSYVDSNGTYTVKDQGALLETGNPLDLGLEGEGLMEIETSAGVRYTRNGAFKINQNGFLVTKEGHYVLSESAENIPPEQRRIQIDERNHQLNISYMGEVFTNGEFRGKISMYEPSNWDAMAKEGSSFYRVKDNMDPGLVRATKTQTYQGFVERSNVNIVNEMTDMIATTRVFESTQDIIKAFDTINGKLINDVPKV